MKDKIDLENVFTKYDKSGDNSLDMKEYKLLFNFFQIYSFIT